MKKLNKLTLEQLAKEMPVLSEIEQRSIIGGDNYYLDCSGIIHLSETTKDEKDVLSFNNNKGSLTIDKGILSNMVDRQPGSSGSMYEGNNPQVMGLYSILVKYSPVEYAVGKGPDNYYSLVTDGSPDHVGIDFPDNVTLISHNHPEVHYEDLKPSYEDWMIIEKLKVRGYGIFEIIGKGGYYQYDVAKGYGKPYPN